MRLLKCLFIANGAYKNSSMKPTRIVVHSTGANNKQLKRYSQPTSTQKTDMEIDGISVSRADMLKALGTNANGNHWNRPKVYKCVNAMIGVLADGSIGTVQTLPWTTKPWGCGSGSKGSYNSSAIQFEIQEDGLTDKSYFEKVFAEAIDLCAYLCHLYDIKVSNIVSHKEAHDLGYASNHGDPDSWMKKFGKDMKWFRTQVQAKLDEVGSPTPTPAPTTSDKPKEETKDKIQVAKYKNTKYANTYKVSKAVGLNLRLGADTTYKSLGLFKKGTVVRCYGYYNIRPSNNAVWLYVVCDGKEGYMALSGLSK